MTPPIIGAVPKKNSAMACSINKENDVSSVDPEKLLRVYCDYARVRMFCVDLNTQPQ
jgi:glutaminase